MLRHSETSRGGLRAAARGYGWWTIAALPIFLAISYYSSVKMSQLFTSALGLFLSLFGILISVFGFVVAISQIMAARDENEKISDAMQSIKRQFNALEVAAELRSCRSSVEEAIGHISDRNWVRAIYSCNGARISLVKIASLRSSNLEINNESAKDFAAQMLDGCSVIERLKVDDPGSIPGEEIILSLRKLEEFLIEAEYAQKDGVNG